MNCTKIRDMIYEEDSMSLFNQVQVWLHVCFCQNCAEEIEQYQNTRTAMREDFFPILPKNIEDSIMVKLHSEQIAAEDQVFNTTGTFSTRGWVIAGLILVISLVTAFFGMDFRNLANESGMSFMLPMGITIGIALTIYGAFFIGSHLKELSERFGL